MLLSETLCYMNTRQIAGSIIRDELSRIVEGNESVRPETLRAVEGLLGFPRRYLDFVVNGDIERIARLKDMDPDLRRHTLDALDEAAQDGGEDSQDKHRRRG
jgi:hypothetical protein